LQINAADEGAIIVDKALERRAFGCDAQFGNDVNGDDEMRKAIPETMFTGREQPRLSVFQNWVIENAVTEIEMSERQFWSFVSVQPLAEKPWTSYMGRLIHVVDMPEESQKCLGLFDKRTAGNI
jgi:hypothetical protein